MRLNKIDQQDIDLNQPNDEKTSRAYEYTYLIWAQTKLLFRGIYSTRKLHFSRVPIFYYTVS